MSKKPKVGRPRKFREKTTTISVRVPKSKAKELKKSFNTQVSVLTGIAEVDSILKSI